MCRSVDVISCNPYRLLGDITAALYYLTSDVIRVGQTGTVSRASLAGGNEESKVPVGVVASPLVCWWDDPN